MHTGTCARTQAHTHTGKYTDGPAREALSQGPCTSKHICHAALAKQRAPCHPDATAHAAAPPRADALERLSPTWRTQGSTASQTPCLPESLNTCLQARASQGLLGPKRAEGVLLHHSWSVWRTGKGMYAPTAG